MPMHPLHDTPPAEEDIATRKTLSLAELREERTGHWMIGLLGVGLLLMAAGAFWFAGTSLRRGYVDSADYTWIVYAANDPFLFYGTVLIAAGAGLVSAVYGVRTLMDLRRSG